MKVNWKRALAGLWALSLVLAPVTLAEEEGSTLSPKISVEEPIADVGKVVKGDSITHEFLIYNIGKRSLELREVRPACGCTVVEYDKVIAPGKSGKVVATLDTAGLRNRGSSKTIQVFTNDPENPRVTLTMQAQMIDYLVFNPGFARFVKGKGYEPGVVTQIFYTPNFDGLEIEKIESPFEYLTVEHRPATEDELRQDGTDKQHVLTLTMDYDKAPAGPMTGNITVHTNHPKQPIAWLPFSGFVRPLVAVTPPMGDFGEVEVTEDLRTNFLVKSFAPFPLKVTKVEQDLEGAVAKVTPLEEGKAYNVEVTFEKGMPKGPFKGVLKIHTDSEKEPLLLVPMSGSIL